MTNLPACTFLIPVRDARATLGAAAESALAQTLPPAAVVVVDDGSSDGSAKVALELAACDPRVRVIRQPPRGIADALNAGLAAIDTPYVARLDADDLAQPQRLARQLPMLAADDQLAVVDGQVELFRDDGTVPEGMRLWADWINAIDGHDAFLRSLLIDSPVVHPAATLRREAILAAGGYRSGEFPEDYDLWLRLERMGHRFGRVHDVLVRMRDREDRLTRTSPAYRRAAFRALARDWLSDRVLGSRRRVCVWGAGQTGRSWIRWLASRGQAPVAVIDIDPNKIGRTRGGAPVVEPRALERLDSDLCLVAVAARGARALIRTALSELRRDWVEGRDWWAVA